MSDELTVRPVGDRALLLEAGSAGQVAALYARLLTERAAGRLGEVAEIVPAARTLLLDGVARPRELAATVAHWTLSDAEPPPGPLLEVPTVYDGADLAEVAALWGLSPPRRWRCTAAPSTAWRSAASLPASAI